MVSIGISEFTFGYAFLHEQTIRHWSNLYAAPILPSLIQEADQGWDAHIPLVGDDFYYQFKLSEYLVWRSAKYIKDGTYNDPYFRISLHKNNYNRQHRRLKAHASLHPHTYYVAPEFTIYDDFNEIFLNSNITTRSRLIPLNDCDDIYDNNQHYITYQKDDPSWIQHSESRKHEWSILGENIPSYYEKSYKKKKLDLQFAVALFKNTIKNVKDLIDDEEEVLLFSKEQSTILKLLDESILEENRGVIFKKISEILSIFYGLTMVILTDMPNKNQTT